MISFCAFSGKTGTTSWSRFTTAMGSTASRTPSHSPQSWSSFGTTSTIHWWSTTPPWTSCSPIPCPASSRLVSAIVLCFFKKNVGQKSDTAQMFDRWFLLNTEEHYELSIFKCNFWLQVKEDTVDVAGRKLKEVHGQYQEKTKEFDRLYEAFTKTSQVKTNLLNELWWSKYQNSRIYTHLSPESFLTGCVLCDAGDPDEANSYRGLQWDDADLRGAVSWTGALRRGIWEEQSVRGSRQRSGEVLQYVVVPPKMSSIAV